MQVQKSAVRSSGNCCNNPYARMVADEHELMRNSRCAKRVAFSEQPVILGDQTTSDRQANSKNALRTARFNELNQLQTAV